MSRIYSIISESILVGLSFISLGIYFYVAFSRISYPFTVEWVESNTFLSVVRVLESRPIFIPPSFDFIPMIYTPFYYYAAAFFAVVTDQIMFSMRLVSILASLLIFIMIFALCRLRKIKPQLSIIAVGLFAASYAVTGYWLDIGRVDTLFLALLLTGYVLAISNTKQDNAVGAIAGIVIFLSFATKQSAILAVPFVIIYLLINRRWKKALWLGVSFLVSWGLFILIMNMISDGWFWIYTQQIPSAHPISWDILTRDFWVLYIFSDFRWLIGPILLAVLVFFTTKDKAKALNYAVFVFTFFLPLSIMSVTSMAKQWGYINGLLPIVAALIVISIEAYQHVATAALSNQFSRPVVKVIYFLLPVIILLQFIALRYDFSAQIPTRDNIDAGNRILKILENSEDPVFIPTSPYLLYMADQQTHFQASSLGDLNLASQHNPVTEEATKEQQDKITERVSNQSIKTIFLPNATWYDEVFSIENGYKCESLVNDYPPLITLTGAISYLDRICRFQGEPTK